MNRKKHWLLSLVAICMFLTLPLSVQADEVQDEIKALKRRLEQLEKKLSTQDEKIEKQEQIIGDHDTDLKALEDIKEALSRFEFHVDATTVVQGTIKNEDNHRLVPVLGLPGEGDDTDASYSVDIEISSKIGEHGKAFLMLEATEADGLRSEIGGFTGVNYDARHSDGDDDVEVAEVWYEHRFFDGQLALTFGKIDPTRWFDTNAVANDEETQFLSDNFVNNIAIEWPEDLYAYGARLSMYPSDMVALHLGFVESNDDFEDIFDDNLMIAEIDFMPKFGELQGNYRFYGWKNSGDHTRFPDPSRNEEEGYGLGCSIDQQFSEHVSGFGRFGYVGNLDDDDIYPIEMAWSIGLQLAGGLWGRNDDMFGIAYGRAVISEDYRDFLRTYATERSFRPRRNVMGLNTTPAENRFEAYYRLQLNKHLAISPDIQVVEGLAGVSDARTVTIVGARAYLSF